MRTDSNSGCPHLRFGVVAREFIVALTIVLVGLMQATAKAEDYRLGAGQRLSRRR